MICQFPQIGRQQIFDDPGLVGDSYGFYNPGVRQTSYDSVGGANPFARARIDSTVSARHYWIPPFSPATPPSQSRCPPNILKPRCPSPSIAVSCFSHRRVRIEVSVRMSSVIVRMSSVIDGLDFPFAPALRGEASVFRRAGSRGEGSFFIRSQDACPFKVWQVILT